MDGDFCLAVSIKSILSKEGVFFMKPGITGSRTIRHFDLFLQNNVKKYNYFKTFT